MGCEEWDEEEITKVETPRAKRASGEMQAVRETPAIESAADFADRIAKWFCGGIGEFEYGDQLAFVALIESDRASIRAQARKEALERAAQLCMELSLMYGTRSEGENEPEFSQAIGAEFGARACVAEIRSLLSAATDGGGDG